jgi:Tfp pilus assembly protein PilF
MAVTIAFPFDRVVSRTAPPFQGAVRFKGATLLLAAALSASAGCGLLPTRDDISSAGSYVKDHVTGKARTDRMMQTFSEARILERRQDFLGAEKLYHEVLAEEPRSRDCYHRLAVMKAVQGKYQEAHSLYAQALQCGNPTADLWSDIGWCHYMQQQLPEAEGALRNAISAQPQHRGALNNLAMVVGEKGNLDESYQLFRKSGTEAEADCNFGYLCAQMGDLPRAQQHFSRALSKDPEMRPAADALLQVTGQMQEQMSVQQAGGEGPMVDGLPGAVAQAGGQAPGATGPGVQTAAHEQTAGNSPARRLIEVFRGGRRPAPSSLPAPATPQAPPANPAGPPPLMPPGFQSSQPLSFPGGQPQNAMPAYQPAPISSVQPSVVQPMVAPSASVVPQTGPAPFSMPNQSLPQYLQPNGNPSVR